MRTFWILMAVWHDWRAAVWEARWANPPLDEDKTSMPAWERWCRACEIMHKFHARRFGEIRRHLESRP